MDTQNVTYTYNKILFNLKEQYATMQINLEDIMLGEISQSRKDKYCMIPLMDVIYVVRFIGAKSRIVVSRG